MEVGQADVSGGGEMATESKLARSFFVCHTVWKKKKKKKDEEEVS